MVNAEADENEETGRARTPLSANIKGGRREGNSLVVKMIVAPRGNHDSVLARSPHPSRYFNGFVTAPLVDESAYVADLKGDRLVQFHVPQRLLTRSILNLSRPPCQIRAEALQGAGLRIIENRLRLIRSLTGAGQTVDRYKIVTLESAAALGMSVPTVPMPLECDEAFLACTESMQFAVWLQTHNQINMAVHLAAPEVPAHE